MIVNADIITKGIMQDNLLAEYAKKLAQSSISEIANEIYKNWKPVHPWAKPYLEAMITLQTVNDNYGSDSGHSVIAYFLGNAAMWKGEAAKAIKKELNKRIK